MTTPGQQEFTVPAFVAETPLGSKPWQRAELYLPQGIMRVVSSVGNLVTSTIVDLRDVAFKPNRRPYREKEFQEVVALGRDLLATEGVDLRQVPAGYPELEALVAEARKRPSVMLPDLIPGQHYLYTRTTQCGFTDSEVERSSYTVFQFESLEPEDFYQRKIFNVHRRYDPQLDKLGHVILMPDFGMKPCAPNNLTLDQTEAGFMARVWEKPDRYTSHQFHEVTSDNIALIATMHAPVVMAPYIRPNTDSGRA